MRLFRLVLALVLCSPALAQTPLGEFSPDLASAGSVLQLTDGRVLFATNGRVEAFTPEGERLGVFANVFAVDLNQTADGRVLGLVASERVEAFAQDGTPLGTLVSGLQDSRGLAALRDGRIAVSSWTPGFGSPDRIQIFSSEGVPLDTLRADDDLYEPTNLMQMADGRLLVSRLGSGELLVFGEDGALLGEGASMTAGDGQAVQHPDGRVFVTDNGLFTSAIHVFDPDLIGGDVLIEDPPHLHYPYGIELLADGRLVVLDGDGAGGDRVVVFGDIPTGAEAPVPLQAISVAPNPFSDRATISLRLAAPASVQLTLHDVLGREAVVLVDEDLGAGAHRLAVEGAVLTPGVYVWQLVTGEQTTTGQLTLVR